jgi:hypothetical protein
MIANTDKVPILAELEKEANEAVNTITGCIDAIRSVQEFHPPKEIPFYIYSFIKLS